MVIQYSTGAQGERVAWQVQPALQMRGVITAQKGQECHTGFEGFGVALTGSSCYNLMQMEKKERRAFLESIYGKDGLGLTIARLSMGASDYSAELYTYDDVPDDRELVHFSIERERAYIIPVIREVLEIAPELKIFASPWSPPGWMKTGGSVAGGYMRRQYLDCYADYFVKFLLAYREEGITIQAVTVQNETETDQKGLMTACIWHPDLEAEFVSILRRKLNEAGLDTKIWIHDHNFSQWQKVDWQLSAYPELERDCDGIAFHYYSGAIEDTRVLAQKYPNLPLHFTEGGPRLYDNYGTDWCKWVIMMSKVLREGYRSFCGWNLMLDETGGPNVGPFFCGGLVTRNRASGELSYSGQYKAFAHVAPYVRPDSKIYPLEFTRIISGVGNFPKTKPVVYGVLVENGQETVLLLANPNSDKSQVQYCHKGTWYYFELLPDTAATVILED